MMFVLRFHIPNRPLHPRRTHRIGGIAVLPGERAHFRKVLAQPLRRTARPVTQDVRHRKARRMEHHHMQVIVKPANRKAHATPHFPVFPEFQGASYQKRYDLLCQRLIQEQLYTVASVLTTSRTAAKTGQYQELSTLTSLQTLITTLAGHIAAESARR
ncbi:MAG: hypothetical protein KIT83_22665 [Bryobacterales bacterium]|nr:hypothetical protein [Bryobacterales bacterium]